MKTLFVLPLATVLVVALLIAGAAAVTPDFAIQSEVWTLDAGTWDVRPCAHLVYFAGPLALEDRADCGLPWAVTTCTVLVNSLIGGNVTTCDAFHTW